MCSSVVYKVEVFDPPDFLTHSCTSLPIHTDGKCSVKPHESMVKGGLGSKKEVLEHITHIIVSMSDGLLTHTRFIGL